MRTAAEWGSDSLRSPDSAHRKTTLRAKQVRISPDGASTYTAVTVAMKKEFRKVQDELQSGEKSAFGQEEILVVGHLCGPYGRRPSPTKIDAIQAMKEVCDSQSKVKRFLGHVH